MKLRILLLWLPDLTFALLLYYTGCRISEGLAVTYENIDYSMGGVVFNTLKRRKDNIYRFVPLPSSFFRKEN